LHKLSQNAISVNIVWNIHQCFDLCRHNELCLWLPYLRAWSRIFLVKLIFYFIKIIPTLYENRILIAVFTWALIFYHLRSILVLSSHIRRNHPSSLLSWCSPTTIVSAFFTSPCVLHSPHIAFSLLLWL
jgi:hypothetical protein